MSTQPRLEYSPVGVCFPSDGDFAQSAPEDESFYLSDDPDCASLAGSVLVSGSPVPVSGSATGITDLPGASLPDRRSPDMLSPEPSDVQLPRLDIVRIALSQRGFSERVAKHIAIPQRSSTRLVYEGKWAEFCAWCDRRKEDPVQASVPLVADFLTDLFERNPPLTVSTIHGYRSTISATVPHGPSLTNSRELGALMRSFAIDHPVTCVFYPRWSLWIVLNFLMKPPFEPIAKCSLENLTCFWWRSPLGVAAVNCVLSPSTRNASASHPTWLKFSSSRNPVSWPRLKNRPRCLPRLSSSR